jgi:hypothetical protein
MWTGPKEAGEAAVKFLLRRLGSFCPPDNVTVQRATDAYCKYLHEEPEKRSTSAAILFG